MSSLISRHRTRSLPRPHHRPHPLSSPRASNLSEHVRATAYFSPMLTPEEAADLLLDPIRLEDYIAEQGLGWREGNRMVNRIAEDAEPISDLLRLARRAGPPRPPRPRGPVRLRRARRPPARPSPGRLPALRRQRHDPRPVRPAPRHHPLHRPRTPPPPPPPHAQLQHLPLRRNYPWVTNAPRVPNDPWVISAPRTAPSRHPPRMVQANHRPRTSRRP
jgi:hypothetical protein